MHRKFFFYALFLLTAGIATGQTEKRWIKHQIATLSGNTYHGRGYVSKGSEKAAGYIARKFKEFGLIPAGADSSYQQQYFFPVNTFPGAMFLKLNKKEMIPGADYIIHAASQGYSTDKIKVKNIDLQYIKDSTAWAAIKAKFEVGKAYILKNADTVTKYLKLTSRTFAKDLPKGVFIIPKHGKLIWTVARDTVPATVFYVEDTVMPKRIKRIEVAAQNKFETSYRNNNVIGVVPGTERPDSFILFTAHFDHLGMMGKLTMFPGAHDNASGTSLMLYLASYFAQHPQKYSMMFIGFSGEEAGLMGSDHFVKHPLVPLSNIRFVVNVDMTGDATDGITIVNAQEQQEAFAIMNKINEANGYLPKMNQREQTNNSDHYHFSEAGVPAVFIFGLGAKGFYHDVFDKSNELSLNNIDKLARLLIDFAIEIQ